jgi:alpha-L-rhamnosidase
MLSFNHYAYGAVIDWVYRHVAGIAPDVLQPGYRKVILAPRPAAGIDWARASVETPFGRAAIDWRIDADGSLAADVDLPFGTSGEFRAPVTGGSTVSVDGTAAHEYFDLRPGRHRLTVTAPLIAGRDRARAAVSVG